MGTFKMDVGTVYSQPGKLQAVDQNITTANDVCICTETAAPLSISTTFVD